MGDPPRALSSPPGLWAWAIAAAMVGLTAIAGTYVTLRDEGRQEVSFSRAADRQSADLDSLPRAGARKGRLVVVLGNSLVWAALERDGTAQRLAPSGIDLVVLTSDFR